MGRSKRTIASSQPVTEWDKTIEQLLSNWGKQIAINEMVYRRRAVLFKRLYYAFGVFLIVTSTTSLSTLISAISYQKYNNILIFVAVLDTLVLIAAGLDKFFNFGADHERYFIAATEHDKLCRKIETTLIFPRIVRGDAKKVLLSFREDFDKLKNDSPALPHNKIIHKLEMWIYEDPAAAVGEPGRRPSDEDRGSSRQSVIAAVDFPDTRIDIPPLVSTTSTDERNIYLQRLDYEWQRMQQHSSDRG